MLRGWWSSQIIYTEDIFEMIRDASDGPPSSLHPFRTVIMTHPCQLKNETFLKGTSHVIEGASDGSPPIRPPA
jgi:hypothetical protein